MSTATPRAWPSPAEEETLDVLSFDEWLMPRKEASVLVRVESSSLAEEGILPGDAVIVERGRTPRPRDLVLVDLEGAWTLERRSAIAEQEGARLVGVITAVIRKYF